MEWKKDRHAVPCHTNLICRGRLEDQIWCSLNSHFMLYVFLWCPFYLHIKLFSCKPSLCGYICFISTTLGKNKSVAYWLWVFQACGLVKCFLGLKWSLLQIYYGTTRHSVSSLLYRNVLRSLWAITIYRSVYEHPLVKLYAFGITFLSWSATLTPSLTRMNGHLLLWQISCTVKYRLDMLYWL